MGRGLATVMISAYSIPALLAFLAKLIILRASHKAVTQDRRARLFRAAVVLSLGLNVAEFVVLQRYSYLVNFNGVVVYYAISALVVPLLVHLAISISIDSWDRPRFLPVYAALYGTGIAIAALFAFATPLLVSGVEDMRGYTVTTVRGSLYWLYQTFLICGFAAMLALPVHGLRIDRDKRRRSQCKLWIAATTPLVVLVLAIILLLQFNIRWFNATVTSPLLITLMLATIGYVIHKRRVIELDFYIPGSQGRKRKISFYEELDHLERKAKRASSLSDLINDIALVFACPVALITNAGSKQLSDGAPLLLSSFSTEQLCLVQRLSVIDDPTISTEIRGEMSKVDASAIIPFFADTHTLSFWLVCGRQFSRRIYSALDFKRLSGLIDKLSGLLLERALTEQCVRYPTPIIANQTLERSIEELEARLIRDALSQAKGKKAEAARLLGIRPNTLHYKLRRYRI